MDHIINDFSIILISGLLWPKWWYRNVYKEPIPIQYFPQWLILSEMSNISECSHNYCHNNGVNYLFYRREIINYIYRSLHGTLNSAPTSFLVDIIENLTFNEDGCLLFPDFPRALVFIKTFMICSEMSRLSYVQDSILSCLPDNYFPSRLCCSKSIKINFQMVISNNLINKF